jgi:hypothetical protein
MLAHCRNAGTTARGPAVSIPEKRRERELEKWREEHKVQLERE